MFRQERTYIWFENAVLQLEVLGKTKPDLLFLDQREVACHSHLLVVSEALQVLVKAVCCGKDWTTGSSVTTFLQAWLDGYDGVSLSLSLSIFSHLSYMPQNTQQKPF